MSDPVDALAINRAGWDRVAPRFFGGTALPIYGPLAPTEETLGLLGPLAGTRVLELGCGSGHSLRYLCEHGAAEAWGLDLSPAQIAFAADVLRPFAPRVRLIGSPMEVDPGIPAGYFDLVVSIYGLGWTTDLPATLARVAHYLKPGGCFVFSGEHPAYGCLRHEDGRYVLDRPYAQEGPDPHASWNGAPIVIQRRTLGTFVNETVRAGLLVEALVETELDTSLATDDHADPSRWYSVSRATMMPTTFILKARKPCARSVQHP
jgi:SAM-dependent methyltransferase